MSNVLKVGDVVSRRVDYYKIEGTIISVFYTLGGILKYAVEDEYGIITIYTEGNINLQLKQGE